MAELEQELALDLDTLNAILQWENIMALRIDINKQYAIKALENAIASLKRSEGKGLNPAMLDLIRQDIALYQNAINTITEIK